MSNIRYALNRLAVLSLASCLLTGPAIAQTGYTDLIAFGDSLTDTGNVSAFFGLPLPPYAAGRLTNGPVWLEGLAGSLGLSAVSSLNGGGNYAWGGARTGPQTGGGGLPPFSLLDQAGVYLSDVGGVADPDALYVIWGGGNDARENDVAGSAADIAAIIGSLAAAGATNFLVPNLPDMGMTPESQAGGAPGGTAAQITAATLAHNDALASELSALSATLTNVTIFEMDVFGLFNELLSNPAGFANVTDPCWDGDLFGNGNECADPDAHLFWDGNSPSAVAHSILGNSATNLVGNVGVCGDSEPATGEQCDDGNTAAGDGCDATCQIEAGSDCTAPVAGILAPPAIVIPPVPSMCLVGLCGDGIASDGEACDDGNLVPGDGCSVTCSIENGFSCTAATTALEVLMGAALNPSFCAPDIDNLTGRAKSGKVSLTWSPVINADSYNIFRGDSSGGPYNLIAASHATTYAAYSDGTVTNGSTYYYVVTAIIDGFESNQSNEAEVTVRGRTRR